MLKAEKRDKKRRKKKKMIVSNRSIFTLMRIIQNKLSKKK